MLENFKIAFKERCIFTITFIWERSSFKIQVKPDESTFKFADETTKVLANQLLQIDRILQIVRKLVSTDFKMEEKKNIIIIIVLLICHLFITLPIKYNTSKCLYDVYRC